MFSKGNCAGVMVIPEARAAEIGFAAAIDGGAGLERIAYVLADALRSSVLFLRQFFRSIWIGLIRIGSRRQPLEQLLQRLIRRPITPTGRAAKRWRVWQP